MISELLAPILSLMEWVVQTLGGLGLFLSMIIQAILVVIPSEGVLVLAGMFMNPWEVTIWAGLGSIAGASVSFLIAKKGGRPIVKKLLGDDIQFMDAWAEKWGEKGVLIGRLIPFIPYDPISYLSGVTTMDFKKFSVYNAIGTIPRVIFFANMGGLAASFETIGVILLGVFMFGLLGASIYAKKKISKGSGSKLD